MMRAIRLLDSHAGAWPDTPPAAPLLHPDMVVSVDSIDYCSLALPDGCSGVALGVCVAVALGTELCSTVWSMCIDRAADAAPGGG